MNYPLRMYLGKAAAASVFIGFFLALSAALGQAGAGLEPQAEQILLDSCNFLKSASEFEFSADVTYDEVEPTGQKIQYGATFTASVKRPDRLRSVYRGDLEKRSIWYDGRRLTLLDGEENLFATTQAPPRIDQFLDLTASKLGFTIPGADLLYSDPFSVLNGNVERGYYAGLHSVNGIPCHHLAFSQDNIDWQIWIEDGETMVPRKLTITYKDLPGSPQYTAVFPTWDFSPSLLDEQFSFRPPAGAEKIDFLLSGEGEKRDSMKWVAALSATCLLSSVPLFLSEALADHRRGHGSIRHSREYQERRIELDIEFEDRNALRIEREKISAEEEARREAARERGRIELEREREEKTRDFLDFQEALRESSRASRRAPRHHYYRKPGHELSSLPCGHRKVSVKGEEYHYCRGVFFRSIPSGFVAVTAPGGAVVDELPVGHTVVSPGERDLYYFFGTFFAEVPGGFEVVRPSAGAFVPYLPDGYQSTHVDGDLHYVFGGIHYRPYYRDGILVYAVVGG